MKELIMLIISSALLYYIQKHGKKDEPQIMFGHYTTSQVKSFDDESQHEWDFFDDD
jgi:hypothetical protein